MSQPYKPMGPKRPARSLRESEQLLAGAAQTEGLWIGLKVLGLVALVIFWVGLCVIGLLDFAVWLVS